MKTISKASLKQTGESKFFEEVEILKSLDHPNILRVFEFYQNEKKYYLITEYCSGGNLFNQLKTEKQLPTEQKIAEYMQ